MGVCPHGPVTEGIRDLTIPVNPNAPGAVLPQAGCVPIRCLLVDDSSTFLESARALLGGQGVTVAGTASSTAEALRQASALRPDVAVVDIGLGNENGFDLAVYLSEAGVVVIMVSAASAVDYADLLDESPAAGFLPKTELSAAGIQRILGRASGHQEK
jgi:DNA-binding NarL/FixJ family response regulator